MKPITYCRVCRAGVQSPGYFCMFIGRGFCKQCVIDILKGMK